MILFIALVPGASGPLLGRHDDRSPRSAVDLRQIKAGNARQVGSQEAQELELSQRRMRSPWRVPRRSAERRAARDRAAAAQQKSCAVMAGAPIGAPPPFFVRMISSENRTPLFGIMRGRQAFSCAWWFTKLGCFLHREDDFVCRAGQGAIQLPLIPAKAGIQSGSPPSRGRAVRLPPLFAAYLNC